MRLPFALRSTADNLRTRLALEQSHNAELSRSLAHTMNELHKHKLILGERSSTFKRAVVTTAKVSMILFVVLSPTSSYAGPDNYELVIAGFPKEWMPICTTNQKTCEEARTSIATGKSRLAISPDTPTKCIPHSGCLTIRSETIR